MKRFEDLIGGVVLVSALLILAGCGEAEHATSASTGPIQGDLIQGEPIAAAPVAATAQAPADSGAASVTEAKVEAAPPAVAPAAPAADGKPWFAGSQMSKEEYDALQKKKREKESAKAAEVTSGSEVAALAATTAEAAAVPAKDLMAKVDASVKDAGKTLGEALDAGLAKAAETADKTLESLSLKTDKNGYSAVSFKILSAFQYEIPDEFPSKDDVASVQSKKPEKDQIPAPVRGLNKRKVTLEGFMLPLKVEDSLVTEMLILKDQSMCCYGSVPRINEWVSVRMTGKGVKPVMDMPVTLYGTLKVGEIYENGYLVGIYEMDGDRIAEPLDL